MAAVYRAYQTSVDREVAIKVILQSIALDEHTVQRFQREARLIARLEHPHILNELRIDAAGCNKANGKGLCAAASVRVGLSRIWKKKPGRSG